MSFYYHGIPPLQVMVVLIKLGRNCYVGGFQLFEKKKVQIDKSAICKKVSSTNK